jgi:hypothetical protein
MIHGLLITGASFSVIFLVMQHLHGLPNSTWQIIQRRVFAPQALLKLFNNPSVHTVPPYT